MDTKNGTIGGGQALDYWGKTKQDGPVYLDYDLIKQFLMIPYVKAIIVFLLLIAAALIIVKILEVRNPLRGKAITNELTHLDKVKKHDEAIVKANRYIQIITKIVEKSPLALNKSYEDYWSYNLSRANVRIPGGYRIITPKEFNAIISFVEVIILGIGLILTIFVNAPLGVTLMILDIVLSSSVPMMAVRAKVKEKDTEVVANFADFYLMIHYVLLASASTPVSGIMKSYDKTTSSNEMHRFVDTCIHYIDTYGEYEATRYISRQYREIPEVGKLMRLIRQANEGGDIRAELMGFRDELLAAKEYAISCRMEKLVTKAKLSFNILVPVLLQAIISAMAIYLDDLSMASSIFGS